MEQLTPEQTAKLAAHIRESVVKEVAADSRVRGQGGRGRGGFVPTTDDNEQSTTARHEPAVRPGWLDLVTNGRQYQRR